jgi:L-rhamnose mutarotase
MKPVKLGNEKALQITNALHIQELTNKISQYGIDIEYKRYHFLDKNRANELKQKEHSFVLNTYGAKYLLFLTYVNFKPYALYINRKNSTFFLVKTRFDVSLYQDTMLEGETIKINEKWYFYVGDCLVYKKTNLVVKSYSNRYEILGNILVNDYVSDPYMEPFELIKKDKYEYEDIMGVKNGLIGKLPFRVNGYVFKCLEAASYDILYIFPECRNKQPDDESPKNSGGTQRSTLCHIEEGNKTSTIGRQSNDDIIQTPSQAGKQVQTKGKDEAKFLMKKTEFPDVYEIYMFDSSNSKKAKVGYAGIPNIECSVMVKNWFIDKDEIYAKCKKNPVNEKWIPVQLM